MGLLQLPKQYHPDFRSPLIKPIGPVEIDWSNPITKKLKFCCIPQGGTYRDLVTGEVGVPTAVVNGVDGGGQHAVFTDSGGIVFTNNYNFGNGGFTMWFRGKWDGTSGDFQTSIAITTEDIGIYFPHSDVEQIISSDSLETATDRFGNNLPITSGTIHNISLSHPGGTAVQVAYKDNLKVVGSSRTFTGSGNEIQIGAGQGSEYWAGNFYIGVVWSRQLSDAEQQSLHYNPYQVLKPQTPFMSFTAAALSQNQSNFRFGADDGSESAHTWLAAQNVNINQPGSTSALLRIQVDNTGDPATQQMKLQVKKTSDPDSAYADVPVA